MSNILTLCLLATFLPCQAKISPQFNHLKKYMGINLIGGYAHKTCKQESLKSNSPEEYRTMLLSKIAADYSWSGGIKGDCQNDCIENLSSPYGFTYIGNAKYGKPHGKGVMVSEKATYTGDFVAGEPNRQMEIKWNTGSVFNGISYNGELVKGH